MDTSDMLTKMCQEVLSAADIKTICKSRGFSAREASSRTIFENYFLSDIGIEAALASLSEQEIACLHLLKREDRAVDIRFFERLTGQQSGWHSTVTQRYTPVFKVVQSSLIRKGVLLAAVAVGTEPKMERWRFRLPGEFAAFLPPIFRNTTRFEVEGDVRHTALRNNIMAILTGARSPEAHDPDESPVTLDNGQLLIGQQPFSMDALRQWQQGRWQQLVWADKRRQHRQSQSKVKVKRITPEDLEAGKNEQKPFPPLVNDAFCQLGADAWVLGNELSTLLRLFYAGGTLPDSEKICERGWELGCLAKHRVDDKDYYRLAPLPADTHDDPGHYLTFDAESSLCVDLETIPYPSLESLAAIAELKVVGSRLMAMPHAIKLGRATEAVWQAPLTLWLRKNATAFQNVMETLEARRGKQILHTHLLMARVKDLSLKVHLQKTFSDPTQLVLLPGDYIAFPVERLGEIRRVIEQSGYVVKTISAS